MECGLGWRGLSCVCVCVYVHVCVCVSVCLSVCRRTTNLIWLLSHPNRSRSQWRKKGSLELEQQLPKKELDKDHGEKEEVVEEKRGE